LPTDPRLEPFYALAEERDLPVLIHHQGTAGASNHFRISAGHPEQLEEVLIKHPKLRLYMENPGYPFLGEMIALTWTDPKFLAYALVRRTVFACPLQYMTFELGTVSVVFLLRH
jgi:predicted TIM-barrel fold metal-dependent hydrolase